MTTLTEQPAVRTMDDVVELDIAGMTCSACANTIERKLNRLDGVTASVNFATERATVIGLDGDVDRAVASVEKAGYGAAPHTPGDD